MVELMTQQMSWVRWKKMEAFGNSTSAEARSPQSHELRETVDDVALWNAAQRGDETAFATLMKRHLPYLHAVARSLVANAADVEDLVQETLTAALGSHFRAEASLRTWLVRILVRQAAMYYRSKWRRVRMLFVQAADAEPNASEPAVPCSAAGTDARLDLVVMLDSLSPEHRQVIVLRELEGMTYEEMARTLDVPRGTVESRLHRAREQLRSRFGRYLHPE